MSVSFDINGKVAVVTGGAGVLCAAMCRMLVEQGAKVAVLVTCTPPPVMPVQ